MRRGLFLLFLCFVTPICAVVQWSFPATMLSTSGQNASDPAIVIDSNGNTTIAWVENGVVLSSTGTIAGGWSASQSISQSGASSPQLGIDEAGNVIAVWVENGVITSTSKPVNQGWSGTFFYLSQSGASDPQMVVNANGNAAVVWVMNGTIEAALGSFNGSWGAAQQISSTTASLPKVSMDVFNNVIAVWAQTDGTTSSIYSALCPSGGTWSSSTMISTPGTNCTSPNVVKCSFATEQADAIWLSYNVSSSVYSNVYAQVASLSANGTWGTPRNISSAGVTDPTQLMTLIAEDSYGNLTAAWNLSTDGSLYTINFTKRKSNGFWPKAMNLSLPNPAALAFDFIVEESGNYLTSFMALDTDSNSLSVYSSNANFSFDYGSYWQTVQTLSTGTSNAYPKIAVGEGSATDWMAACWLSSDGVNTSIQSILGNVVLRDPPTNLQVTQSLTDYNFITEVSNTLTWSASPDPTVITYRIFRNGVFMLEQGSGLLSWTDYNRTWNESVTYSVQGVNYNQETTQVASVTFP